jgi:hypothetical protein
MTASPATLEGSENEDWEAIEEDVVVIHVIWTRIRAMAGRMEEEQIKENFHGENWLGLESGQIWGEVNKRNLIKGPKFSKLLRLVKVFGLLGRAHIWEVRRRCLWT